MRAPVPQPAAPTGYSMLFRLDANGKFIPVPGPFAINTINVTSVDVITFTPPGGFANELVDPTGSPRALSRRERPRATLSLTTNLNATCRYSTAAGVPDASMTNGSRPPGSRLTRLWLRGRRTAAVTTSTCDASTPPAVSTRTTSRSASQWRSHHRADGSPPTASTKAAGRASSMPQDEYRERPARARRWR